MQIEFSIDEINDVAKRIVVEFPNQRCMAFYAEMGSGKTTLIHAMCEQLGVIDAVSSPTFSIINEYKTLQGNSIFHMDWYRLKGEEDAIETGVQDILEQSTCYCFIEWAEIAEMLLPKNCLKVRLNLVSENRRLLLTSSI
jgi:tRNA threonylcarbamoyladenosine biosynthesis protein TsaE